MGSKTFFFHGTITARYKLGLDWGVVIFDNNQEGMFSLQGFLHIQNLWMAKRFVEGGRVYGRAQECGKRCTIIWMVPEGYGFTNIKERRDLKETVLEFLEFIPWILNTKARQRNYQLATLNYLGNPEKEVVGQEVAGA